jgi:hypothetical protein
MKLPELTELKDRCHKAAIYGRHIGHAADYALALEAEAGPVALDGVKRNSAEHLIALIEKVERVRGGEAPEPAEVAAVEEPKKKAKKSKKKDDEADDEADDEEPDFSKV